MIYPADESDQGSMLKDVSNLRGGSGGKILEFRSRPVYTESSPSARATQGDPAPPHQRHLQKERGREGRRQGKKKEKRELTAS